GRRSVVHLVQRRGVGGLRAVRAPLGALRGRAVRGSLALRGRGPVGGSGLRGRPTAPVLRLAEDRAVVEDGVAHELLLVAAAPPSQRASSWLLAPSRVSLACVHPRERASRSHCSRRFPPLGDRGDDQRTTRRRTAYAARRTPPGRRTGQDTSRGGCPAPGPSLGSSRTAR